MISDVFADQIAAGQGCTRISSLMFPTLSAWLRHFVPS